MLWWFITAFLPRISPLGCTASSLPCPPPGIAFQLGFPWSRMGSAVKVVLASICALHKKPFFGWGPHSGEIGLEEGEVYHPISSFSFSVSPFLPPFFPPSGKEASFCCVIDVTVLEGSPHWLKMILTAQRCTLDFFPVMQHAGHMPKQKNHCSQDHAGKHQKCES